MVPHSLIEMMRSDQAATAVQSNGDACMMFAGAASQARETPLQNAARYTHLLVHRDYLQHRRVRFSRETCIHYGPLQDVDPAA